MRLALVHDWLTGMRGGEKVLEVLCELMPSADLYTLVHVPGSVSPIIEQRRVIASPLNKLPGVGRYYRYLLPWMPWAAGCLNLEGYDLAVVLSHCVAHGVRVSPQTRLVRYCFTPMRYAWNPESYFPRGPWRDPRYWGLRLLQGRLREWDRRASRGIEEYIATGRNVAERIRSCYGRDSVVIHCPVDSDYYRPLDAAPESFYLWVGALAPYKRIDMAMDAFRELGRELIVIGAGQELAKARRTAPPNVRFLGWQPDDVLRRHYASCQALIFPGEEDFGIVPLEAQACGRPVIAYGKGGARETVVDIEAEDPGAGPTGVLFEDCTAAGLVAAIRRFEKVEREFNPETIRRNALRFSRQTCKAALKKYLFG